MSSAGDSTATAADSTAASSTAGSSAPAKAANSYEAFKVSLHQAEAAGDAAWQDESEEETSSGGLLALSGAELKGLGTGILRGVGFLIAGACILLLNVKYFTQGERTVGIVVGHKDFYNRRSANVFAPVVNYSAPGGVYKTIGNLSVSRSIYPIDTEVPVLYLRDDPSNAVIADFVQMFLIPTVVGSFGLICLTGTIAIMLWTIRRC